MGNKHFEKNVNSNRNGTDKINLISENLTKIKVSFDFFPVADVQSRKFRVSFKKELGVRLLEHERLIK